MCMFIQLYMCEIVYVYVYVNMVVHAFERGCACICMRLFAHVCVAVYVRDCMCTWLYVYMGVYVCVFRCICICLYTYVCMAVSACVCGCASTFFLKFWWKIWCRFFLNRFLSEICREARVYLFCLLQTGSSLYTSPLELLFSLCFKPDHACLLHALRYLYNFWTFRIASPLVKNISGPVL